MPRSRPRPPAGHTAARRTLAVLGVLLLLTLFVGAWVGLDLFSVRDSLTEARAALVDVRSSLGEVEVEAAEEALTTAEAELDDARGRTRRLPWTVAARFPVVGDTVDVTRDIVEVASAAVDLGGIVLADARELFADGLQVEIEDGQVDLAPLLATRDVLARVPVERLRVTRDELARPRREWLPDEIVAARAEILGLANETLRTVEAGRALTQALPVFLGADGPRRYFVGFQTSAELRGTGGLISFWGVLGVEDGQVTFGQSEVYDPIEGVGGPDGEEPRVGAINTIGLSLDNPAGADPEYLRRYDRSAGARSFPNINLDPDLPTTAKAVLDLFELQTGTRLDGVVMLDPPGLQSMLQATGDTLELGGGLAGDLGLEAGLPTDAFADYITADIYDTLGADRNEERDAAFQEIGDRAFEQLLRGGWDAPAMLQAIGSAAGQRHLQVFTTDARTQAAFTEVGATGRLDLPAGADRFAVTANNVVGGKQDVHLGHEFRFDVALDAVVRTPQGGLAAVRTADVEVTVDNPLPSAGRDDYVIGNCFLPGEANRCFEGPPGWNRTLFSVWSSPDTVIAGFATDDGGDTEPTTLEATFRGLRVVDHFVYTPPEDRGSFSFRASGDAPLRNEADSVVYELSWWRQAKAIPDLLEVTVSPPEGWAIGWVEVLGGGEGTGAGVHGAGVELTAEVEGGRAILRGTVTADTRLLVHLVAPDEADG
jgi:hypothetical protein